MAGFDQIWSAGTQGLIRYISERIHELSFQSQGLEDEAEHVLNGFEDFMYELQNSGKTVEQVELQLAQFMSSLETCERTVSSTMVTQQATEGTMSVIRTMLRDIDQVLDDTAITLKEAEELAESEFFSSYLS